MMEDEDNSQSVCSICGKRLSRKQTLAKHLQVFHKIQPECSPVKYKRYLNDPTIPVPRTTQYIKRKRDEDKHETVQEFPQPGSGSTTLSLYTEGEMSNSFTEWHCDGELEEKIDSVQYSELIPDDSVMDENNISTFELHGDTCMLNKETNKTTDKEMLSLEMEDDSSSVSSDADSFQYSELDDFKESDNSTESEFEDSNTIDLEEEISKFSEFDEKCMAILSFVLKHHLSWQASLNFTELIGIFLKEKEISLDKIKQMVGACQPDIIDFCDKCFTLFPENENIVHCLRDGCTGLRFKGPITKQSARNRKSYFACLPLQSQIKSILEREGVWDALSAYRKKCRETTSITDILNGELYKLVYSTDDDIELESSITLLFNTDGVPLYKSSGISIWPVYLVINELPPMMRFSRKNLILWGVWQAKGKPMFQTFFQPFVKQMIDLKNNGIVVKLQNVETTIKAALIAGTLDLQAKAIVADMTQHNGQYGCITCLEPGEVVKQGRGHCRVFPFRENGAPPRSSTDILQNGIKATENGKKGKPVEGIKGVSCLHGMDWFDVVYGLVPDYMHGTLLGVTKKLLHLFFSPSNSGKPYFIGKYIKEVDKNLKKMQPTDNISRLPRKLEKNLHHLKASELEVWLLFYSIPCLKEILKPKYLNHLALMVEGIYILLSDDITSLKMNRAERVLSEFYHLFPQLYGFQNCSLNLHNLGQHLIDYVKKLGPLWAWSCFPFEDFNGSLLEYAHGTGDVCLQILWTIQAQKRLAIDAQYISNQSLRNYVQNMVKTRRMVKIKHEALNCKIAGSLKPLVLNNEFEIMLREKLSIADETEMGQLSKALRVVINDEIFFSKQYTRMSKRIAHTVLVQDEEIQVATIEYFIYHKNSTKCFALVSKLEMEENPLLHPLVNHLICLKEIQNQQTFIIPVDKITEKVLYLNGNKNHKCISRLPNLHGQCN